jgi:hypothetical protein
MNGRAGHPRQGGDRGPEGCGTRWMDHVLPFQYSASADWAPASPVLDPTAIHDPADGHDTPASMVTAAPAGRGTRWMDHLVPFHRSASGPAPELPTTVPALADQQDTPASELGAGPCRGPAAAGVR